MSEVHYTPEDIKANTAFAICSYLSILVIVPLLAAPNSPYARFHANQGLVLLICEIAIGIIGKLFSFIIGVGLISWLGSMAALALSIIGIVYAAQGLAKPLPVIGGIQLLH